MASPISSPQNLIALEYMNPPISWLGWFAVSIPVALICIVIIWFLLLWSYRTGRNVVINPVRVNKEAWTPTQYFVSGVTLATIALWCVESKLSWLFGDMGIIAILPIVSFYGTGILRKVCLLSHSGDAARSLTDTLYRLISITLHGASSSWLWEESDSEKRFFRRVFLTICKRSSQSTSSNRHR